MDVIASNFDKVGLLKIADKCLLLFYEKGAAEVVFAGRSDAFQALKRYNNVKLDGKPKKIEILNWYFDFCMPSGPARGRGGATSVTSLGILGKFLMRTSRGGRGGFRNAPGHGRGRGQVNGRASNKGAKKSAEELDKELDSYHASAEAMQT
uniref:THO complex subunit 4D-like n=1 Tax=Nicotiana sylvestris TaxID=4096 RepID=A0A1U7XS28_NICSY|nr:PREDICTED: THO complex subunit 4D-like [Nicotiana sylvestris]